MKRRLHAAKSCTHTWHKCCWPAIGFILWMHIWPPPAGPAKLIANKAHSCIANDQHHGSQADLACSLHPKCDLQFTTPSLEAAIKYTTSNDANCHRLTKPPLNPET